MMMVSVFLGICFLMPLLHLAFVHSPGKSASSLRCRLLSSNHLHSPGDLSLEFCIYSRGILRCTFSQKIHPPLWDGLASVCLWTGWLHCFNQYLQYMIVPPCARAYLQLDLHMSFHEIGLCRASSQVVHYPCWPCCTAFVILAFSISLFFSWMITPIFGRWPSNRWNDFSRFHDDRLGRGLVFLQRSQLLLTFLFPLRHWIFSQIRAAAWIQRLYLLILNSSATDLNGIFSFALLLQRANEESPGGNPSHFLVSWLMHLSIASTVGRPTSYIVNGHNSLGRSTNCTSHTLNLPGRNIPPIVSKLSFIIFHVALSCFLTVRTLSLDFSLALPAQSGFADPPPGRKHHCEFSLDLVLGFWILQAWRTFYTTRADRSFCQGFSELPAFCSLPVWCRPWTPWLKTWNFWPIYILSLWDPTAFRRTCIANTKRHGEIAHSMAIPTWNGIHFVVNHRRGPHLKLSETFF